jgi:hypothetical protein
MCQICFEQPGSHSFYFLKSEEDINYYYTYPAKAIRYWDTNGIVNHYDEILHLNGEKSWIWIFDSKDFGLKHTLQTGVAFGILELLKDKYGKYLKEIQIINPSIHIKSMYTILYPFLTQELIDIIKWDEY